VATIERLKDELAEVRRRGYAIDDEENEAGARCVGAPILDHRGQCAGAISVSGSASRLTDERIAALAEQVRSAAAAISRTMGYQTRD